MPRNRAGAKLRRRGARLFPPKGIRRAGKEVRERTAVRPCNCAAYCTVKVGGVTVVVSTNERVAEFALM